jgi:hypothetical protein
MAGLSNPAHDKVFAYQKPGLALLCLGAVFTGLKPGASTL